MLSIFYVLCCIRRSPKAERDGDKKFVRNTDFLCNNAFYHFLVFFPSEIIIGDCCFLLDTLVASETRKTY